MRHVGSICIHPDSGYFLACPKGRELPHWKLNYEKFDLTDSTKSNNSSFDLIAKVTYNLQANARAKPSYPTAYWRIL